MDCMFATPVLALQIDGAEGRLCEEIADAVGRRRPDARVGVWPVAGGVAVFAGAGAPANKVVALGLDHGPDARAMDVIEQEWQARGEPVRIELSTLADPRVGADLTGRGYQLAGFENVLGLSLDVLTSPPASGVRIEPVSADTDSAWMTVMLDGFGVPDEGPPAEQHDRSLIEGLFRDMADARHFSRYLATVDGVPVGAASLRLDGTVAQLCGAATLPAHRRKGVQSALLASRLVIARNAGCEIGVVTTQPGSKSAQNADRRGFRLLYARAVLVKTPGPDARL